MNALKGANRILFPIFNHSLNLQNRYCSTQKGSLLLEKLKDIQLIGINRPDSRNCIDYATSKDLLQAFKDFDGDDSAKVAVLYGVGGHFCAGLDLKEIATDPTTIDRLSKVRGPVGPTHYETSKPVIAAVDGYAVAGGMELALWCDIRIMDEKAIMGVFCRRFGVPLIDGGTFRLPAIVGVGRALDFILTGDPISAEKALEVGLANQVSSGNALQDAIKYAEGLVNFPQEALRADRNSARRAFTASSIEELLQQEHERGLAALQEAVAGAGKFVEGEGRHGEFK